MSNQLPLPLDNQPAEPQEDLAAYQQFLTHDRYRNQISVSGTQLLQHFLQAARYMEEIHRKQLQQVDTRLMENSGKISRTTHNQLAMIVNRYLPKIAAEKADVAERLQAAVLEAGQVEKLAAAWAEEVTRTRARGNIKFVQSLTPKKAEAEA